MCHAVGVQARERTQADRTHTARDVAGREAGRAEFHEGAVIVPCSLAHTAWPICSWCMRPCDLATLQLECALPAVFAADAMCFPPQDTMASTMKHIDIPEPPRTPGSS